METAKLIFLFVAIVIFDLLREISSQMAGRGRLKIIFCAYNYWVYKLKKKILVTNDDGIKSPGLFKKGWQR